MTAVSVAGSRLEDAVVIGLLLTALGVLIGLVVGVASLFVLPRAKRRFDWIDALFCLLVIPALVPLVALFVNYVGRHGAEAALTATYAIAVAFPFIAGRLFRLLRGAPGRRSNYALLGSAACVLLLVGGWVAMEQTDRHRGLWLFRMLFGDSFNVEVQVALTVDGEPVRFARRITCIDAWTTQGVSDLPAFTSGEILYADTLSIGTRVPTGGAVMLVLPDWCREVEEWAARTPDARDGATSYPLPEDYLPLIAWTPTPDDPEMIEAYVARSYYQRPDARVRFHELTVRLGTPGSDAPKEDEFAWFFPSPEVYPPEDYGRVPYLGLYVVAADEAEWSQAEPVARLLNGIEIPTVVEWGPLRRDLYQIPHVPRSYMYWRESGRTAFGELLRPQIMEDLPETRAITAYTENFVPLRRNGNAYEMASQDHGLVLLYRSPDWAREGGEPLRIRLGGRVLAVETPYRSLGPALGYTHLFEPKTGHLYALGPVYIHSLPPQQQKKEGRSTL